MTLAEAPARPARPRRRGAGAVFARLAARLPAARSAEAAEVARLLGPLRGRSWTAAFLNAHAFNLCASDPAARAAFEDADLLLRDGAGAAILMRLLGRAPGANANGTDLIPRLACAPGARVAIYGGRPGAAEAAAHALRTRGAEVVAARHGYHPVAAYAGFLRGDAAPCDAGGRGANLVILGMGAPRQEHLARTLRAAAPAPVGILCGGGVLDFLSGRAPRAPRWMRRLGLEWLFRLGREPRRLFRRYVIGNPLFVLRALSAARVARRRGAEAGSERQRPAIRA
ncbi:MAG: WecB/TagA/CpsF family glycosyltransferase [Pseudomonadota bacterium]